MKVYWRYATLTLPTGTPLTRTHDHAPSKTSWPETVRAKLQVNRQNEPMHDSEWQCIRGVYGYHLSRSAPGVVVTNESFKEA